MQPPRKRYSLPSQHRVNPFELDELNRDEQDLEELDDGLEEQEEEEDEEEKEVEVEVEEGEITIRGVWEIEIEIEIETDGTTSTML